MNPTRRNAIALTAATIAAATTGTVAQTGNVSTKLVELIERHHTAAARFNALTDPIEAAQEQWEKDSKALQEALVDVGNGRRYQPLYVWEDEVVREINSAERALQGNVSPAFMEQAKSALNEQREVVKAAYAQHHDDLMKARAAHHVTEIERQYDAAFDDMADAARALLTYPARADSDRAALAQWMRDYFAGRVGEEWEITALIEGMAA